ncbi:MAG: hypothetical protein KGJ62_02020 [Armatimonadetes bacterium]|nr:hypothetical protein [Armatimonadota bacterium]MDE2206713.1 hypothetical protein [Armatimonadota bacterium]
MERPPRRLPAVTLQRSRMMAPVLVALFACTIFLQHRVDPTVYKLHHEEQSVGLWGNGLNNEFMLLPLLGFREAAAGLLWVRADQFFDSGDYDAILPLVRLITWLDPHDENVYVTGAWHLAYNFTDSEERSDRRYIAPAMALLDEGIRNNETIPDVKFEKAWQCFDKVKDYAEAEKDFKLAINTKPYPGSADAPYGAPLHDLHELAHAYEREGRIPEALDEWNQSLERSAAMLKVTPTDTATQQLRKAEEHNYSINLQRYYDRYTTINHDHVNPTKYPAVFMPAVGSPKPSQWDVDFQPHIDVIRPKVFRIHGRFNTADGSRVWVRIEDADYKPKDIRGPLNTFQVDPNQTVLIDSISVRKARFDREMDMSRDPKMYSFSEPTYKIVLWYDARASSPHLLDRFGWSGEGMTDNDPRDIRIDSDPDLMGTKFIDGGSGTGPNWDGKTIPWGVFGQPDRLIMVTYQIDMAQVNGLKPITDADRIPNTDGTKLN